MQKVIALALVGLLACSALVADGTLETQIADHRKTAKTMSLRLWISAPIAVAGFASALFFEEYPVVFYAGNLVGLLSGTLAVFSYLDYRDANRAIVRLQQAQSATFTDREREAIAGHEVFVGMSERALLVSLGEPSKINSSTGSYGVHKQYVYDELDAYVYVENGKITAWQTSE